MTAREGEVVATARPWVATGRYVGVLNHKSYVAECRDGAGCWTDSPMAFANAKLIVRSVNSHDDLVAALKEVRTFVADERDVRAESCRQHGEGSTSYDHMDARDAEMIAEADACLAIIDAALSRAGGV